RRHLQWSGGGTGAARHDEAQDAHPYSHESVSAAALSEALRKWLGKREIRERVFTVYSATSQGRRSALPRCDSAVTRLQQAMANIYDVARSADVSVATVSAVVNGTAYVSPRLKARVEAAVKTLGYQPNHLARGLATQQSRTLGLVVPDLANPF